MRVKFEEILSKIQVKTFHEQTVCSLLDSDFLNLLSNWIKINIQNEVGQERLLASLGSFPNLMVTSDDFMRTKLALSDRDIVTIRLLHEAALRLYRSRIYQVNLLQKKADLIQYLIAFLAREPIEHFFVYFLDKNQKLIAEINHAKGTINTTSIYIREIARLIFQYDAASIILVHNHPSGVAQPSEADKILTEKMIKAMRTIKIHIADHLIIGNGTYYSFAEEGLLIPCD